MKSTLARTDDGTIQLTVTIPWEKVVKAREEVVAKTASSAKMPGFRAGKAPKKLVEDNVDVQKIQEEVLKEVLPQAYIEAIQEHELKPIVNPKVHVQKIQENEPWIFTADTCELPEITLGNYKEAVKELTAKNKIAVPGKEQQQVSMDEMMQVLTKEVKVTVPKMLTDFEVDRLLSQTLDEIKKLGLNLDQYLASTGKNPEVLRKDYEEKAKNDITIEFALQKIADTENITVDEKEVEEAIQKAKDPAEKAHLESNKYLLSNILRQQKTLDFLRNL
jgi:FKBP-type peptidyl-prolyl cis-trans isomerase (trigger factor)